VQQGLARADAIVITGDGGFAAPNFTGPVLRACLVSDGEPKLEGRRVLAFAGIGQPQKFFRTLRTLGAEVVGTYAFPDHHVYSSKELARLRDRSGKENAMLITTEKDFVRLSSSQQRNLQYLPVRAAFDDPNALSTLLETAVQRTGENYPG
jgi:tetraacyldisaccharide 4'-kinase